MAIQTSAPYGTDGDQMGRTTGGLLIATVVLAVPQMAFAAFVAVWTWVELSGMTAAERDESWTELGYYFAAVIAVPPLLAAMMSVGAWVARRRALGQGLAIGGLCIAGLAGMFYLTWFIPGV